MHGSTGYVFPSYVASLSVVAAAELVCSAYTLALPFPQLVTRPTGTSVSRYVFPLMSAYKT